MPSSPEVCGYENAGPCLAGCKSGNGGICKYEEIYFTKYGLQAKRYFGVDLPLEVLKSNAGFYIGTFNHEDGPEWGPCSRESEEYYKTESAAGIALAEGLWTQRLEP